MKKLLLLVGVLLLLSLSALAQAPGPVARIYRIKVKPGMEAKFEEAYKGHIAWHREQNDSWVWDAWIYESGDYYGQYVVVTPGHHWSDFDSRGEMGAADVAHAQEHLLPLVDSISVSYSMSRADFSRMSQGMPDNIAVARVTEYHTKPGKAFEFEAALRRANQALNEAKYPGSVLWTQDLTGPGGVYALVEFYSNWSSLAPPQKSVLDAISGQLGQMETSRLVDSFFSCVESTDSQLVRYLPELSYAPSGQ